MDKQEVILRLAELTNQRTMNVENLLLGVGTLAIAGWAFLYARELTPKKKNSKRSSAAPGATAFLLVLVCFSGLVPSTYLVLFQMMTAHDIIELNLESQLDFADAKPFLDYYNRIGLNWERLYLLTAFAIPVLGVVSIFYGFCAYIGLIPERKQRSRTEVPEPDRSDHKTAHEDTHPTTDQEVIEPKEGKPAGKEQKPSRRKWLTTLGSLGGIAMSVFSLAGLISLGYFGSSTYSYYMGPLKKCIERLETERRDSELERQRRENTLKLDCLVEEEKGWLSDSGLRDL